jgi:hypothetical protein
MLLKLEQDGLEEVNMQQFLMKYATKKNVGKIS